MLGVDDYQALVQAKRPKLKPNSARTYAVSLNTIAPPDSTNANWVSDVPYVLKQLDRYKDTTKKNTLNAVIVLVEADSITKHDGAPSDCRSSRAGRLSRC
jgi:hypothetical protein